MKLQSLELWCWCLVWVIILIRNMVEEPTNTQSTERTLDKLILASGAHSQSNSSDPRCSNGISFQNESWKGDSPVVGILDPCQHK